MTVASTLLAHLTYDGVREAGLRKVLPAVVWTEIPPMVAGLLLPYFLIRLVYRSRLRAFGVSWFEPGRPVLAWFASAAMATLVVWAIVWVGIFTLIGWAPVEAAVGTPADLVAANPLHAALWDPRPRPVAYVLHMFIFVGFAEELLGRGLLQNALDRGHPGSVGFGRCRVGRSTVIAALLFAAWHIDWLVGSVSGVLGSIATSMTIVLLPCFLLCFVYEKTRSMAAVIALHNVIDGGKLAVWYMVGHAFTDGTSG